MIPPMIAANRMETIATRSSRRRYGAGQKYPNSWCTWYAEGMASPVTAGPTIHGSRERLVERVACGLFKIAANNANVLRNKVGGVGVELACVFGLNPGEMGQQGLARQPSSANSVTQSIRMRFSVH